MRPTVTVIPAPRSTSRRGCGRKPVSSTSIGSGGALGRRSPAAARATCAMRWPRRARDFPLEGDRHRHRVSVDHRHPRRVRADHRPVSSDPVSIEGAQDLVRFGFDSFFFTADARNDVSYDVYDGTPG